jgi:hypothetical protein
MDSKLNNVLYFIIFNINIKLTISQLFNLLNIY